ncbi:unnamed protein product [Rangifer tarandus platyrhynchus]|uniref:Uncharacterized protein n=3 Tax=Rangifer tarandus platyrhynchus TaxID=3082113 RepID=A0ACB0FJK6_RANTA|nr:unnamed protein product [Rangifer tarandus platyrhynchus]CAI9713282.1 unnamed protein product [Rangifer tarandus platyrhynchus]
MLRLHQLPGRACAVRRAGGEGWGCGRDCAQRRGRGLSASSYRQVLGWDPLTHSHQHYPLLSPRAIFRSLASVLLPQLLLDPILASVISASTRVLTGCFHTSTTELSIVTDVSCGP